MRKQSGLAMEERRRVNVRRFVRGGQIPSLLPITRRPPASESSHTNSNSSNPPRPFSFTKNNTTICDDSDISDSSSCSCSFWYCDYKITALNSPVFRLGRRHVSLFRLWFSVGVGFTLTSLLAVSLILVWELCSSLLLFLPSGSGSRSISSYSYFSTSLLFGFSPWFNSLRLSIADAAYLLLSTSISVSLHELGHAFAAASDGIKVEYVSIFMALLFPGALVAFNFELLQALDSFASLRVYCAGIWHNAVCCAVCGLALFLLPLLLSPFYIHGESPMVLDVPSTSPLFGYLSHGDVIVSVDGKRIHDEQDWMKTLTFIDELSLRSSYYLNHSEGFPSRKGYCVASSILEGSNKIYLSDNQSSCPDGLTEFLAIQCSSLNQLADVNTGNGYLNRREDMHCLNAKDVVKLNKCGNGWPTEATNGSNLLCSTDQCCLGPVQLPGSMWAEITHSSHYTRECLKLGRDQFSYAGNPDSMEHKCGGTFVFVGELVSIANSVILTAYQPRWGFGLSPYLPEILSKSIKCTFHVSLTIALLNSLPVYFLDGESVLEVAICSFTSLGPRKRARVLQACLLGGTLISVLGLIKIFFISIFQLKVI